MGNEIPLVHWCIGVCERLPVEGWYSRLCCLLRDVMNCAGRFGCWVFSWEVVKFLWKWKTWLYHDYVMVFAKQNKTWLCHDCIMIMSWYLQNKTKHDYISWLCLCQGKWKQDGVYESYLVRCWSSSSIQETSGKVLSVRDGDSRLLNHIEPSCVSSPSSIGRSLRR